MIGFISHQFSSFPRSSLSATDGDVARGVSRCHAPRGPQWPGHLSVSATSSGHLTLPRSSSCYFALPTAFVSLPAAATAFRSSFSHFASSSGRLASLASSSSPSASTIASTSSSYGWTDERLAQCLRHFSFKHDVYFRCGGRRRQSFGGQREEHGKQK